MFSPRPPPSAPGGPSVDLLPGRWFLETSVLGVMPLLEAAPGAAGLGGAAPPCWKLPIFLLRSQEDGEARREEWIVIQVKPDEELP